MNQSAASALPAFHLLLTRHDALSSYIRNCHSVVENNPWVSYSYNRFRRTDFLNLAFQWSATPQGREYWHRIRYEWLAYEGVTVPGRWEDPISLNTILRYLPASDVPAPKPRHDLRVERI